MGYTTAIFSINKSLEFSLSLKKKGDIFNNQLVKYKYSFDSINNFGKLHKRIHSCLILQSPNRNVNKLKQIEKNEILADNIFSLQIAQSILDEYEELKKNLFILKGDSEPKDELSQEIESTFKIERRKSVSCSDHSSDIKSGLGTPKFSIESGISNKVD